ncbi:MAG: O-antigen ligase family protein [Actinomycetota bacterium]|nr:O-antigen ligase family protein [Actinomycetota bacterium]
MASSILVPRHRYSLRSHPLPGPFAAFVIATSAALLGAYAASNPVVAVALAAGAVLAICIAMQPDIAALLVLAVIYSNAAVLAVTYHGMPAFVGAAVPMLLVAPLVHLLLVRRERLIIPAPMPWVLAYLLVQIAGTILASSSQLAATTLGTFVLEGVGLYLLVTNVIRTPQLLRGAVWVLLTVGALLGGLSVFQEATGTYGNDYFGFAQVSDASISTDGADSENTRRLAGPVDQSNRYAQIMLVLIPIGVFRVRAERSARLRLVAGFATLLILASVMLTFSRGAAVGLFVTVIVMALLRYIKLRTFLGVLAVIALLLAVVPQYRARLSTLSGTTDIAEGGGGELDSSVRSRATENVAAFLVFIDHPVVGVGPGRFPVFYGDAADRVEGEIKTVKSTAREAHNLYLGVAAENGILGLLFLGGVFIVTLRDLGRTRRRCRDVAPELSHLAAGFMLAIVAYMATAVFLHFAYIRYFWVLMALAAATGLVGRKTADEAETRALLSPAS